MDMHSSSSSDRLGVSEAELAALADGTLSDPDRRAELQRRIAASPELTATYERERRMVLALAEARRELAPAALRMRIDAERPTAASRIRWRLGYGVALAGGVAVVLLVVALALPGGPGGPSVSQAAALALRGSVAAGPAPDPSAPAQRLEKNAGAVYFPNWAWDLGWRAVGQRTDSFHGRPAVTVYYQRGRQVVAYTIVEEPALRQPSAPSTWIGGVDFRTLHLSGRIVVTWRRSGQTCILSGQDVSQNVLDRLASWGSSPLHADRTAGAYAVSGSNRS